MLKIHDTYKNEKNFFDLSAFFNFIFFQNLGINVSFKTLSAGNLALTILSGKSVFVRVHIFLSRVPFLCYTFLVKYSEPLATWCVIASNNYPWGVQATMNKCSSHINSPTSSTRHKLTMDASWACGGWRRWRKPTGNRVLVDVKPTFSISCPQIPPPAAQQLRRRMLTRLTTFKGDLSTLRFSFRHCDLYIIFV